MTEGEALSADYDGTSVWVHRGGECVARFGRVGYEVFSPIRPGTMAAYARCRGVEDWKDFEKAVWEIHRFRVPFRAAPIRFHDALGITADIQEGACRVPLHRIRTFFDPFESDVWGREPVTYDAVEFAIARGNLESDFVPMGVRNARAPGWDARRIAHMVVNPDPTPIEIEVSADGEFEILDGYHRLSAAIFREDAEIAVILSGCVAAYDRHFGERTALDPDWEDADDGLSPGW